MQNRTVRSDTTLSGIGPHLSGDESRLLVVCSVSRGISPARGKRMKLRKQNTLHDVRGRRGDITGYGGGLTARRLSDPGVLPLRCRQRER